MGYNSTGSREFFYLVNLFKHAEFCTYVRLDGTINKITSQVTAGKKDKIS